MLNQYFDHIYLINLDNRPDRLETSYKVCNEVGLNFERYRAIAGSEIETFIEYDPEYTRILRWNRNAAALVATTLNILKEAKLKKYQSILILEDDIQFNPALCKVIDDRIQFLPNDWELFYFGATHLNPLEYVNKYIGRLTNSNSCHCYAIRNSIYDELIELISPIELPIDYYLRKYIHPKKRSYAFIPNMAFQFSGYSDIQGAYLNTDFIRQQ